MTEFRDADLQGSRFDNVDLSGAELRTVDLSGARFRAVDLTGVVMRGVDLVDVDVSGEIERLVVNGVDVAPLVTAELDRRDPDRVKMRPTDPAGFLEAWDLLEELWERTEQRARRLDPEALHESVGGEWSFTETLRHLVFATDAWVRRAILGDPSPWDPLDLPWDEMPDTPGVPRDRAVRPTLDTVLALRRDRMATVREVIEGLTPDSLDRDTQPVEGPGWPPPHSFPVRECLLVVLNEEWEHRKYAERDLAVLDGAVTGTASMGPMSAGEDPTASAATQPASGDAVVGATPAVAPTISVMLIVPDAAAAIAWYAEVLGARRLWNLGGVAGLEVGGAPFFIHEVNPGNPAETSPDRAGVTSTRIEVFVDDPDAIVARARVAGATEVVQVQEHPRPWGIHRQGGFTDPAGHRWSVGDRSPLAPLPH